MMATEVAIDKAREQGMAMGATVNTGHYGSAGHYVYRAMEEGMIAFSVQGNPTNRGRQQVPPEQLFLNYVYFSSYSDTMLQHACDLARDTIRSRKLTPSNNVLEIASNDGYLLQYYQRQGIPVLGIEPARNVALVASTSGIPTLSEFFGIQLAEQLSRQGYSADIIHAHNVLAHVPDLNGFAAGLRKVLKPLGQAIIEVPYLKDMLDGVEFDTIYHEHLCYFSLTALSKLFERHRLAITHVERISIHGGTLRLFLEHESKQSVNTHATVAAMLADEAEWGVNSLAPYLHFSQKVSELRERLVDLITTINKSGKRIAVYGASAKGSTFMNCFGLKQDLLDFIVDRSPIKQGMFAPGNHLKIFSPQKLLEEQPDYVLLLTWNFDAEILAQQAEYRQRGGRFIIPLPKLRVA